MPTGIRTNGRETPPQRFNKKYIVKPETSCWEWIGFISNGYGKFKVAGKMVLAHRFSYSLFIGELDKLLICHSCDNPKCVNPLHLFKGTSQENCDDKMKKGRHRNGKSKAIHPSVVHYRKGCRCDGCKTHKAIYEKQWKESKIISKPHQ